MNPFRDREIITPDDEEDIADRKAAAYEREIDRADYLRDERRDREMEERETAREVAEILRNSLPVAVEPAPPVPQSLLDEASAKFMRETPAASPPRFFRDTTTGMEWEFRNGVMTTDGEDSIFRDPADILGVIDVIEVDINGIEL